VQRLVDDRPCATADLTNDLVLSLEDLSSDKDAGVGFAPDLPGPGQARFPKNGIDRNVDTPPSENITKLTGYSAYYRPIRVRPTRTRPGFGGCRR